MCEPMTVRTKQGKVRKRRDPKALLQGVPMVNVEERTESHGRAVDAREGIKSALVARER